MHGQTHQRIAVGRGEAPSSNSSTARMKLRRHLGAAAKDSGDADFLQRNFRKEPRAALVANKQRIPS